MFKISTSTILLSDFLFFLFFQIYTLLEKYKINIMLGVLVFIYTNSIQPIITVCVHSYVPLFCTKTVQSSVSDEHFFSLDFDILI